VGIVPIGVCFSLSMSTDDDEEEENAVATLTTNLLLDADADDLFRNRPWFFSSTTGTRCGEMWSARGVAVKVVAFKARDR
tara:strand:+ start:1494 stop:1733 length:240 start_codon:yes stop_codon:yes gene_type:complete